MVAGPERTKMVFEHMFNKMGSKQIKQNFVDSHAQKEAMKVKKHNQKVKSVASNALKAVKLFMRKGKYEELDFCMIMDP